MKALFLILLTIASTATLAENYRVGAGTEYYMSIDGTSSKLSIYVVESSPTRVGVEYYFFKDSFNDRKMWQQYIFDIDKGNKLKAHSGFIQNLDLSRAEKITNEQLANRIELDKYIFIKKSSITKLQVGFESLETSSGSVETTHYQKRNGSQTLDFWISEEIEPIKLVKLISKDENVKRNNYRLELVKLLRDMKRKINPGKAKGLSKDGKKIMSNPLKHHFDY